MSKVAIVTGANQGLGLGLVQRLNEIYQKNDIIYMGVRRTEAGKKALESIETIKADIRVIYIDISKEESIIAVKNTIFKQHGGIDLVIHNAAARISPDRPYKEQVKNFIDTNNMGTYYMLKHFQPLMNENGQLIVVASAFGSLIHLNSNLHKLFDIENSSLEDINTTMMNYVHDVESGREADKGWPEWINIPSKIGQVALVKIAAKEEDSNKSIFSVCPGLVDTDASRPFFDNMNEAQSPYEAAGHIIALTGNRSTALSGQLIQFGKQLPWN
ncbi:SDR family NAD(P)-dependent oxidoreductase [Carboxylicivirga sp. RSCT41]|uniref:SDR family NAD(P)-dependent oxidoreductase n=1 Tax=Carboxylicivirga agarovorans TaxID=3417570 RepID=UPI003D3413D5